MGWRKKNAGEWGDSVDGLRGECRGQNGWLRGESATGMKLIAMERGCAVREMWRIGLVGTNVDTVKRIVVQGELREGLLQMHKLLAH